MEIKDNKTLSSIIYILNKLVKQKKLILCSILIGFIVGCVIAYSIPSKYVVTVSLSPESGQGTNNNLTSMTSMLGLNINTSMGEALNVSLFPEIIKSTPFLLEILNIKVHTQKDSSSISLSEYIETQKKPWWNSISLSNIFSLSKPNSKSDKTLSKNINPFYLPSPIHAQIKLLQTLLKAETDNKTNITQITVIFQDPVVAAIIADSTVTKLQSYITEYRVKKAIEDYHYLSKLYNERKNEYYLAQKNYASFSDANRNIIQQVTKSEIERLQNEMNLAYQVYSQVATQLQIAKAKIQEDKPVFAIVEPSFIPLYPASPNKSFIIIAFIIFSFCIATTWILFKDKIFYIILLLKK